MGHRFPTIIPEDARWDAERQAVEFWVEIGEYHGVLRVPRRVLRRLLPERSSGTSAGGSWPRAGVGDEWAGPAL